MSEKPLLRYRIRTNYPTHRRLMLIDERNSSLLEEIDLEAAAADFTEEQKDFFLYIGLSSYLRTAAIGKYPRRQYRTRRRFEYIQQLLEKWRDSDELFNWKGE